MNNFHRAFTKAIKAAKSEIEEEKRIKEEKRLAAKKLKPVILVDMGIVCDRCKAKNSVVVDSRSSHAMGKGTIRRRRKCLSCGFRWSTFEMSQDALRELRGRIGELLRI